MFRIVYIKFLYILSMINSIKGDFEEGAENEEKDDSILIVNGDIPADKNSEEGATEQEQIRIKTETSVIKREVGGISWRIEQIRDLIKQKRSSIEVKTRGEQLKEKFSEFKKEINKSCDDDVYSWLQDIEFSVEDVLVEIQVFLAENENFGHNETIEKTEDTLVNDALWQGLKKVSLPIYSGDRKEYDNWAASFDAIIDKAPISAEHKMLHLKSYLAGEAAEVIKNLGHSASAYEVAKERLGRKFGGTRRRTALFLEEIENFSNIRPNNAADLTKFADLLDILTVNLKESNMTAELGAGLLYVKLQKKLPKNKLAAYHRWLFEKKLEGSVVHLRTWILQENAFDVIAEETTRGLLGSSQRNSVDTYHGNRNTSVKKCKVCEASHELKDCPKFPGLSVGERSERVKS